MCLGFPGYSILIMKRNSRQSVLEFLHELNPAILAVTGRCRHPCDLGSVENMNKLVKRVLNSVLAKRRLSGENPNWTAVLGSVATAINSQCGHCINNISAYETVFG